MARSTPWLVAAACALAGAGVWAYRVNRTEAAGPPSQAAQLVRKAWTAGRKVRLEGKQQVRTPDADGKTVQVLAQVLTDSHGHMRIDYLTPPLQGVTVWEDETRTYRYNPHLKRLSVADRHDGGEAPELQLLQNYDARITGSETVAARPALVIELRPRSQQGPWKRVSIDRQTGVVLASEDLSGNQVVSSTRFTQIVYPPQDPPETKFRPSDELMSLYATPSPDEATPNKDVKQLAQQVGFPIREPKWLPTGYKFKAGFKTSCSCGVRHNAVRLQYTDGLNTINLFECAHPKCPQTENCFTRSETPKLAAADRKDGVSYLAVGDAPKPQLSRLIKSAE
jgi:hypothetical protein